MCGTVISQTALDQRASVRRALSWATVAALCVAALTAIAAILGGDFDDTDVRVIATSIAFAVFSATAASGASLRFRDSEGLRTLGLTSMALSAVAFVLLLVALWTDGNDTAWRWSGCAALAALACSHASLVSGALRDTDSPTVHGLATVSIALAAVDAFSGILAISGAVDEIEAGFGELLAVLVILLFLTTGLTPILRRLQRPAVTAAALGAIAVAKTPTRGATDAGRAGASASDHSPLAHLATDVLAAADRIEALNADPGNRTPEIRRECARLRDLARAHAR